MKIGFYYDFRPVGQGLFSVGRLTCVKDNGQEDHFRWVHDCGSATLTSTAMTNEIEALRNGEDRPNLDLLILSHFDNDHISGLVLLLRTFRVRRLILPYFTPAERVLIVLSQGGRSAQLRRFLAGPSAFIRSYEGGQETEILFVRKSEGPSPEDTLLDGLPNEPTDHQVNVEGADKPTRDEVGNDPDLLNAVGSGPASMLDGSVPLTIWGHWEFLFYNLPQPSEKLEELWSRIQPEFERFFTQTQNGENPESAIRALKAIYRGIFGTSHAGRNDISLVTYTGPELTTLTDAGISSAPLAKLYPSAELQRPPFNHWFDLHFFWDFPWLLDIESSKPSLLYTGDISLNQERVAEIQRLLTPQRWEAIQVLQVPHHGASSSWKVGLAAKFQHRYSVFSSARYHPTYRHPRNEVLIDLKDTACVLVNEYTGAVFHGGARWGGA